MNKRTIVSIIVFLAVVLLGVSFITPYWSMSSLGGAVGEFSVLDKLNGANISAKINYDVGMAANYIAIGTFALLSLYMLIHLVDAKNRLKWVKVAVSGLTIVAGVLVAILGIVFCNNFNDTVGRLISMSMGIGLILAIISGLAGGVIALIGSFGKSKK